MGKNLSIRDFPESRPEFIDLVFPELLDEVGQRDLDLDGRLVILHVIHLVRDNNRAASRELYVPVFLQCCFTLRADPLKKPIHIPREPFDFFVPTSGAGDIFIRISPLVKRRIEVINADIAWPTEEYGRALRVDPYFPAGHLFFTKRTVDITGNDDAHPFLYLSAVNPSAVIGQPFAQSGRPHMIFMMSFK